MVSKGDRINTIPLDASSGHKQRSIEDTYRIRRVSIILHSPLLPPSFIHASLPQTSDREAVGALDVK